MAKQFLIAHAYQSTDPTLAPEELGALIELCKKKMPPLQLPGAYDKSILGYFEAEYGKDIQIFHFAGHAVENHLVVKNTYRSEAECYLDMEYFARSLGDYGKGLKLVFLNACQTDQQAKYLLDAKVPAVIATTIPVKDRYAFLFAQEFYQVFFKGDKTLEEALAEAHNRMNQKAGPGGHQLAVKNGDQIKITEAFIDDNHRGNILMEELEEPVHPDHIYRLFADDAVKKQTFSDWQTGVTEQPAHTTDLGKAVAVNGGIRTDEAYLLCNRSEQIGLFKQIIQQKIAGQLPQPHFVFINGQNADCIPELMLRMEKSVLPDLCGGTNFRMEALPFPGEADFDNQLDPRKPLLTLEEQFRSKVITHPEQHFGDQHLFVFYHKIYKPFWKDGIESLFKHYIGTYSQTLQQYSPKIVVLFLLIHNDKPEVKPLLKEFGEMYARLKTSFQDRVAYFDKLPLIEESDLMEWHDSVFKTSLDTFEFPVTNPEMYYLEAVRYMRNVIAFNKKNG